MNDRRRYVYAMKALKIDPWQRTVTPVELNLKPPGSKRGAPVKQIDKGLKNALGLKKGVYHVEPLPDLEAHRLIVWPAAQVLPGTPSFRFRHDPARIFGGYGFILGEDGAGYHAPCRLAPIEGQQLIRFLGSAADNEPAPVRSSDQA